MSARIFGVAGWKNSGKTTLVTRLIEEFTRRGLNVGAVKHAHHNFDVDHEGRDTYKMREAGARQVAISSPTRWAVMHELDGGTEPSFEELVSHMAPCDLIIVEGYKTEAFPKIEARSVRSQKSSALADEDPNIVAIAADKPVEGAKLPVFDIDDIGEIADFISQHVALEPVSS